MKIKKIFTAAILAASGLASTQAAQNYVAGDLLLGFRATGTTQGATQDYVVNLGSATQFSGSGVSPNLGNIGADLSALFGANWKTNPNVFWSAVGTPYDGNTQTSPILYATRPRSGVNPAAPWLGRGVSAQTSTVSFIQAAALQFKSVGVATANAPTATLQQVIEPNSYGSLTRPTRLSNLDFDAWNSIQGNFGNGVWAGSILDLFRIDPTTGQPATLVGSFLIDEAGQVSFVQAGAEFPAQPVAKPVITAAEYTSTVPVPVTITTLTSGASIYYTTDGSEPTESSTSYNGQFLVTASGTLKAKGFKEGWTDSSTASAIFQITPDSTDIISPVVAVTTPTASTKFSGTTPTLTVNFVGTVKQSNGEPTLYYKVGDGAVTAVAVTPSPTKAGYYDWTAAVTLAPGANAVSFTAYSPGGNKTAVLARTANYSKFSDFFVKAGAGGTVTVPKEYNTGFAYKIVAKPQAGQIFQAWVDQNGDVVSRDATYVATAEDGTELTADFVENFYVDAAGEYPGIFGDGDIGDAGAAAIEEFDRENGLSGFNVTNKGGFTGTWLVAGQKVSVKGQFDGFGEAHDVQATVKGETSPVVLNIVLDPEASPARVSGTATFDGNDYVIDSLKAAYSGKKGDEFPLAGQSFTALLETSGTNAPAVGNGYLTVKFGKEGKATFAGVLPEGTTVKGSSRAVAKNGTTWTLPVALPLGTTKAPGLLHGELTLPRTPAADEAGITGSLSWLRAPDVKSVFKPGGLLAKQEAIGARWQVTKDVNVLTGGSTSSPFTLSVDPDENLIDPAIVQSGTWPTTNKPALTNPPKGLALKLTTNTGVLAGTVPKPGGASGTIAIRGVLLTTPIEVSGTTLLHGGGNVFSGTAGGKVEVLSNE